MEYTELILKDNNRWSNDCSPVSSSPWLWLFEIGPETDIDSTRMGFWIVHMYNQENQQHHMFQLNIQLCKQLSLLDLEYWSNITGDNPNNNRIARYLEKLREDVRKELQMGQIGTEQLQSILCWAFRIKNHFGHSGFGRKSYENLCQSNGWEAYNHEKPLEYGKSSSLCLLYSEKNHYNPKRRLG
jgi:hypothetical protein